MCIRDRLRDGDYVPDGAGGLKENDGAEEVLARVLFRLTARRGAMPFLPGLGSRLHEVIREKPGARQTLCARYVAQALEEETDLNVTDVVWQETEEGAAVSYTHLHSGGGRGEAAAGEPLFRGHGKQRVVGGI